MAELKQIVVGNAGTIAQDFAGAAALVVIAFVGLSLPGFL